MAAKPILLIFIHFEILAQMNVITGLLDSFYLKINLLKTFLYQLLKG